MPTNNPFIIQELTSIKEAVTAAIIAVIREINRHSLIKPVNTEGRNSGLSKEELRRII